MFVGAVVAVTALELPLLDELDEPPLLLDAVEFERVAVEGVALEAVDLTTTVEVPGIIISEGAFSPSIPIIRVIFPSLITCALAASADFPGIIICEGAAKATTLPETKPKANVNDKTVFLIIGKCMI